MKICKIAGCGRKHSAKGFCTKHYRQFRVHGDPLANKQRIYTFKTRRETVDWILNNSIFHRQTNCLEFQGVLEAHGYGRICYKGEHILCHRFVLETDIGRKLKSSDYVCHKCHNRKCVNIDHLYLGNYQTNVDDMVKAKRHTLGIRNAQAKLDEMDVVCIRALRKRTNLTMKEIGEKFDVALPTVADILKHRTWRHVP